MPFLIDGHNLVHSLYKFDDQFESVDEYELCRILYKYLSNIRERGEIVFDGNGPPEKEPFMRFRNLEVHFSGSESDADTVIEEKISLCTAPKGLTVVSTDRRIREAARKRRCTSLKSEVFWVRLFERLDRPNAPAVEPKAKYYGIPKGEVEMWMRIFGLKDDD